MILPSSVHQHQQAPLVSHHHQQNGYDSALRGSSNHDRPASDGTHWPDQPIPNMASLSSFEIKPPATAPIKLEIQQQQQYAAALAFFGDHVVLPSRNASSKNLPNLNGHHTHSQQPQPQPSPQQLLNALQQFFRSVAITAPSPPLHMPASIYNVTPHFGSFTAHIPQPPMQFYAPIMYHNPQLHQQLNASAASVGGMVGLSPGDAVLPPPNAPSRREWFVTSPPNFKLDYLLQMAHQKYNTQDYSGALAVLQELHNLQPEHLPTLLLLGCTCYSLGLHQLSIYYNNLILTIDTQFAEAYSNLGTTYRAMEALTPGTPAGVLPTATPTALGQLSYNLEMAERFYRMAVTIRPKYWDANINLAGLLSSQGRWKDGLDVYTSIELLMEEEFPPEERVETMLSTLVQADNEAMLVAAIAECEKRKNKRIAYQQATGGVVAGRASGYTSERRRDLYFAKGNLMYVMGNIEGAKREYYKALTAVGIDMLKVLLRTPPGAIPQPPLTPQQVLLLIQQPKASGDLTYSPTTASILQTLAKIYQDAGNTSMAIALYYVSLGVHAAANVCNNVGILLSSHRLNESIGWYEVGLTLDPTHVHLYTNLGSALKDRGQIAQGIECYQRAISLHPDFYIALANLANVYKDQGRVDEAVELYRRALEVKPDFVEAFCNYVNSLFFVCQWEDRAAKLIKIRDIVERQLKDGARTIPKGVPTVLPFHTFTYSSLTAWMVREISRRTADRVLWNVTTSDWFVGFPERPSHFLNIPPRFLPSMSAAINRSAHYPYPYSLPSPPTTHLRIGYVSSDFINHPLAHLMQSVFGLHDRRRFRIYCYSLSPSDNSPYRNKIEAGADVFIDVSSWSLRDIVERIALVDKIHILCNLNGYTKGGRNEIFAARPAPIQMAFMGFAGTMGAGKVHDPTTDEDSNPTASPTTTASLSARNSIIQSPMTPSQQQQVSSPRTHDLSLRRVASDSSLTPSRKPLTSSMYNDTEFFDTLRERSIDYLVADEIACPRKLVCGEPISEREPDVVPPDSPLYMSRQVRGSIVPEDDRNRVYTEGLIYMPYSYFVNDHRQGFKEEDDPEVDSMMVNAMSTSEDDGLSDPLMDDADDESHLSDVDRIKWRREQIRRLKMRHELFPGLPEETVIFANFNQLYKMDPDIFRVWLNILKRVPNAVLWLLKFPAAGEPHIIKFAREVAGEELARRIIFTDVAMKHIHIHRGRVADVFLDTPECNAHTTAADIIWSGTPIITFPKYDFKMCSRVAASIAYATGSWDPVQGNPFADKVPRGLAHGPSRLSNPELLGHQMVVNSYAEYEERAVEFGNGMWWEWQPIGVQGRPYPNCCDVGMSNSNGSSCGSNAPSPLSASTTSSKSSTSSWNITPSTPALPEHNVIPMSAPSESKINLAVDRSRTLSKQSQQQQIQQGGQRQSYSGQVKPESQRRRFAYINPIYPSRSHPTHILVPHGPPVVLRQRLFLTRNNIPLFETDRWVRYLEMGMLMAWNRWEDGWRTLLERNQEEIQAVSTYASTGAKPLNPLLASSVSSPSQRRTTTRCLWIDDMFPAGNSSNY
ncbi:hypothetical protein SeLEV6574_g02756 [Synchytrium endobioticum]|uniref:protein O-GlcNAc transferase n=1 Tax=Synchytrium endobioticum TaxID=286115 RepID=A0A507D7F3_9FUNG|nr:hypothetical protein SeLEV6574_g02756 [Synchytrium endobioticum]